jgi:hypothetical protein
LEKARHLSSGESANGLGLPPRALWRGEIDEAVDWFRKALTSARRLPAFQDAFANAWSTEACSVLPSSGQESEVQWATVVAWCALHAIGGLLDPQNAAQAAAKLFDSLKLREALAEVFARMGAEGEERWRAAARVRIALANEAWLPGARRSARSPYTWLHDSDVAWLINVHEYEGVRYFNKEAYECLLWWMSVPAMIAMAEAPNLDIRAVSELERQIKARMDAAEAAGYQMLALFELGENRPAEEVPQPVTGDAALVVDEEHPEPVKKTS